MKKKLKIGALDWDYDDCVSAKEMGDELGNCDYEKLSIKIKRKMPENVKKVTIFHEIFHSFFFSGGNSPKNEEDIVDLLANQFVMFIQNNPNFFKKIFFNKKKKTL